MKIDLSKIDMTQFMVHQHLMNDEVVHLVQPTHIACKWTQDNKHFRSSVWNNEGELISAGFSKFTNWGENPEHFPTPDSLKGCVCVEKLDGSLLIVSKWKGKHILRTRGTVDASKLDNGYELEIFRKEILPKLEDRFSNQTDWGFSFLFEWLSPANRVVIRVEEPQFKLVGAVDHRHYTLSTQGLLDLWAEQYGFLRPETYSFDSISDLLELVEKWEGKEGVVIYSNKGQTLHKIKSSWYLIRHRLKEEFSNFEKILDFYIQEKCPGYTDFYQRVAQVVDFETAQEIRGDISRCVTASTEVEKIIDSFKKCVNVKLLPLGDPKDKKVRGQMAKVVTQDYGNTNRSSFVFKLLDSKTLDSQDLKKLYYQVLKK
jgi:hypothetical protein